jgi:hypothetical protein
MRRMAMVLALALSTLAHGFWRAGDRLHHLFGGALVLVAAVSLPGTALCRRLRMRTR